MITAMIAKKDTRDVFIRFAPNIFRSLSSKSSYAPFDATSIFACLKPCRNLRTKSAEKLRRLLRSWTVRKIRTHFFEPRLLDALDREEVFDFLKRAALFADIYNRLRGARADSGHLLKLLHRRGVQLDRMSGGVLRIRARPRRGKKNQQNRDAVQCAPNSSYFIHNARIG